MAAYSLPCRKVTENCALASAEIRIPSLGFSATGSVIESGDRGTVVRLDQPLAVGPQLASICERIPVTIRAWSGRDNWLAPARVTGATTEAVVIEFTQAPRLARRRDRDRLACDLQVLYRAVRRSGTHGSWHEATARDITLKGIGLVISGQVCFPPRVELQVVLPGDHRDGPAAGRTSDADGEVSCIVHAIGDARHGHYTSSGDTVVGLSFSQVSSGHISLGLYLQRLHMESVTGRAAAKKAS